MEYDPESKFIFLEQKIKHVLEHSVILLKRATINNYSHFFQNTIPEAILNKINRNFPLYFRSLPQKYLIELKEFYMSHSSLPIMNYFLGIYEEFVTDQGQITENSFNYYRIGSELNDPFCNFKIAECLIRKNENQYIDDILRYLIKSFLMTGFNLDTPQSQLLFESELLQTNSFHYLTYYYEKYKDKFNNILREIAMKENCTEDFIEGIDLIFSSLYDINVSSKILKLLKEGMNKNDKKSAFFYCKLILYYRKIDENMINEQTYHEIFEILDELSNEGNVFASEKLGLLFESRQKYSSAFLYLKRSSKYFLPKSLRLLGNYHFTIDNPLMNPDFKKGFEYSKKAYYLGCLGAIFLYTIYLDKDWERLRFLSHLSNDLNQYGSEYFLGKIYEKGLGTHQDLELAKSIFIKSLNDKNKFFYSLYRIAKINEVEKKNHICDQLYKVLFMIHKSTFDKRGDYSEKWIMNAYRLALMLRKGKGIECDKIKAQEILDEIYYKSINTVYDAFTTIYIYQTIFKKREKNLKEIQTKEGNNFIDKIPDLNQEVSDMKNLTNDDSTKFFEINKIEMDKLFESYEESIVIMTKFFSDDDYSNVTQIDYEQNESDINSHINEKVLFSEIVEYFESNKLTSQHLNNLKINMHFIKSRIEFINLKDLHIDEELLTSHNSIISKGKAKGNKIIAKEFRLNSENQLLRAFEEIRIQSNLCHNNINKIKNVCFGFSPLRLISIHNYMPRTIKHVLLKKNLNFRLKFELTIQILEGVNYLHNHDPPMVHCDLKPENILMDENFNIEICDFGLAKILLNEYLETNDIFTPRYSPPELIKNKITSRGRDIWALGLIIFEIFNNSDLYEDLRIDDFIEFLINSNSLAIKDNNNAPNEVTELIRGCLVFDPEKRLHINELLREMIRIKQFFEDSAQIF